MNAFEFGFAVGSPEKRANLFKLHAAGQAVSRIPGSMAASATAGAAGRARQQAQSLFADFASGKFGAPAPAAAPTMFQRAGQFLSRFRPSVPKIGP